MNHISPLIGIEQIKHLVFISWFPMNVHSNQKYLYRQDAPDESGQSKSRFWDLSMSHRRSFGG